MTMTLHQRIDTAVAIRFPLAPPGVETRLKRRIRVDRQGCWLWEGTTVQGGYGRISIQGRQQLAHRVAYEGRVGPIPEGLTIDHLCRRPACLNPDHMEPVTQAENNARMDNGHWWSDRDACLNGHPYNETNTRIDHRRTGAVVRVCRACVRERMRQHRQRRSS